MKSKSIVVLVLMVMSVAAIAGCGEKKRPGESPAKSSTTGQLKLGIGTPPAATDIASARFTVTDADGEAISKTVPIEREPLPAAADRARAGANFADWLVVLQPGTYEVAVVLLGADGKPSSVCRPAETSALVMADATTEVILTSSCDAAGSGALDATVVFDRPPVIDALLADDSKFVCAGEAFAATVFGHDPEGAAVAWQWEVASAPEGAAPTSSCLASAGDRAALSAIVPGRYELRVAATDGRGRATLTFPVYVSDCSGALTCPGAAASGSLGRPATAQIGGCVCEGQPPAAVPLARLTSIELRMDSVFYAEDQSVTVTLDLGGRAPDLADVAIVLSAPASHDFEVVTLARTSPGQYRSRGAVHVRRAGGAAVARDAVLTVQPGEAFYALYFPDKTVPALADAEAALYSDVAFLERPVGGSVDPRAALTDDEGINRGKPVATLIRKGSLPVQIATHEVIFWARDRAALARFLAETGATVVAKQELPAAAQGASYEAMYLVALTPRPADAQRLAVLDAYLRETEPLLASSADALSIVSRVIQLRLDGWAVAVNPRLQPQGAPGLTSVEGTNAFPSMSLTPGCMPGDPARPCTLNVPAAWAFTSLWDADNARINVGVLDMGFATNADFRAPASGPMIECDMTASPGFVCGPGAAQGPQTVGDSGFGGRSWHGTGMVHILGGVLNNGFGVAGVAGQVAVPMLYKYDFLSYAFEFGSGIRQATADGASCINISASYPCSLLTNFGPEFDICSEAGRLGICAVINQGVIAAANAVCAAAAFIPVPGVPEAICGGAWGGVVVATSACLGTLAFGNLVSPIQSGVTFAADHGVPVVTVAGNALTPADLPPVLSDLANLGERRTERWRLVPAIISQTIVVGAVDGAVHNTDFFGDRVDLWAPNFSNYFSPAFSDPNPLSPPMGPMPGSGTSAAAPYVTGVIALMQAVNPELNPRTGSLSPDARAGIVYRIKRLLMDDANSLSNAELVARGFVDEPVERRRLVDPLAAVRAAAGDRVPDIAALGYDTSLGFSELDGDDDDASRARALTFGVERSGTILSIPGPAAPPPDVDFYAFNVTGMRPIQATVTLTYPGGFGRVVAEHPGLVLQSRGGTPRGEEVVTYRLTVPSATRVAFAVKSPPGEDNVYKVTVSRPDARRAALADRRAARCGQRERMRQPQCLLPCRVVVLRRGIDRRSRRRAGLERWDDVDRWRPHAHGACPHTGLARDQCGGLRRPGQSRFHPCGGR